MANQSTRRRTLINHIAVFIGFCPHDVMVWNRTRTISGLVSPCLTCVDCGEDHEIPQSLTTATGVYASIADRVEKEREYRRLVAKVYHG